MSKEARHIDICKWEKFQQYKDRNPNWIKLLIEIIDEFDADGNPKKFHKMPDSAKLTFILLACLRPHYNKHIPYPTGKWLKTRLGIKTLNLQPLVSNEFITISNGSVQKCTDLYESGAPETETYTKETETETETDMGDFEKFWTAYPKKRGKDNALKWWNKNKPDTETLDRMLLTIEAFRKTEQWQKYNGQFIPYPTTWLNAGGWKDEPPTPKKSISERLDGLNE